MTTQSCRYYKTLFQLYVEVIHKSGLLLDEDLEVLINHYINYEEDEFPCYKIPLELKTGLASLIGGLILANKYSKLIVLPPIVLTTVLVIKEYRNIQKENNQKEIINRIVEISKKINSLYSSIKKYMKTRFEIESKSHKEFFKGYNKNIEDFLNRNYSKEIIFFNNIINHLEIFVNYSNNLKDDFDSIKDFKPLPRDAPVCLELLLQITDIHIWLTSKMLSYLGIIFSSNINNKNEMETLLNTTLPNLLKILNQHYECTKKSFDALRITKEYKPKIKSQINNKLQITLLSAIDNISIISEKSNNIFEKIENSTTSELESALIDLRNHTYATYDSLDLLCKLYGILSLQNIPTNKQNTLPKKTNEDTAVQVHHDDEINVEEENFELYLDKDFVPPEEPQQYTEESEAYLSLMLQELKQSLKTHERFIEAKKRRGSIEEDNTDVKDEVLPQFDLKALELVTLKIPGNDEVKDLFHCDADVSIPPLPPPMPSTFNVNNLDEDSGIKQSSKSLFDNIKTLSSQLNRNEEVFGESDND